MRGEKCEKFLCCGVTSSCRYLDSMHAQLVLAVRLDQAPRYCSTSRSTSRTLAPLYTLRESTMSALIQQIDSRSVRPHNSILQFDINGLSIYFRRSITYNQARS
jgi:hypothetical protein